MKNLIWIIIAAVIALTGYWLWSGQSPKELASEVSDAVDAPAALESASEAVGEAAIVVGDAVDSVVDAVDGDDVVVTDETVVAGETMAEGTGDATGPVDAGPISEDVAVKALEGIEPVVIEEVTEADTAETTEPASDGTKPVALEASEPETVAPVAAEPAPAEAQTTEPAQNDATVAAPATPSASDAEVEEPAPAADATTETEATEADTAPEEATPLAGTATEGSDSQTATATEAPATEAVAPAQLFTVEGFDLAQATAFIEAAELTTLERTTYIKYLGAAQENPEALAVLLAKVRVALGL